MPTYSCPVGCSYCYHEEMWAEDPNLRKVEYNIDAMVKGWETLTRIRGGGNKEAVFHGGEPLLMPVKDMDELCSKLQAKGCRSLSMQTSTWGMNEERLKLFKKYNFGIGISFDGPWYIGCPNCLADLGNITKETHMTCPKCLTDIITHEFDLNRGRGWLAAPQASKEFAQKTVYWIDKLHESGLYPGTISVLNSYNVGTDLHLKTLIDFYVKRPWLSCRFNPVHTEQVQLKFMELSEERLTKVYLTLADACIDNRLSWMPFRDTINQILGISSNECWHEACDPTNTVGASFVTDGTGLDESEKCICPKLSSIFDVPLQLDTTHKPDPWRVNILKQIPFDQGGCKGCKWWTTCKGGCESDGFDGDIRNRTRFCRYLYTMREYIEWRLKNLMPAFISFADLPISEQEKREPDLHAWQNENLIQFQNLVRTKKVNQRLSASDSAKISIDLEWRAEA